jgi:hypothetical protein
MAAIAIGGTKKGPAKCYCRAVGSIRVYYFRGNSMAAWAAANLAIGTLKGEQLT